MIEQVALVLIGFSLCSAPLLLVASVTIYTDSAQGWLSRGAGALLMAVLGILQLTHAQWLQSHAGWVGSRPYAALLFFAASAFFLFFRGALQPKESERTWRLAFFATALLAALIPPALSIPLAFLYGMACAAWLAVLVYRLRAQRARFRLELATFAVYAVISLAVLVLGALWTWLGIDVFVLGYAILIGLGFFSALYLLLRFPDLPARASEAVASAYAVSSLTRVDREQALAKLRRAMDEERVYVDEELSLARLAERVGLTPHQLSELVNTEFGTGFSRWVREHRVAAARRMLLAEPNASVLSVGLSVGFTSQSNFYSAFREITGEAPGRYRSQHAGSRQVGHDARA